MELQARRAAQTGTHALQPSRQLWVLLLNLQLRAGRFGVRDGVDNFTFRAGQLGCTLKVLERLRDLALLQQELGHRADGNVGVRVD